MAYISSSRPRSSQRKRRGGKGKVDVESLLFSFLTVRVCIFGVVFVPFAGENIYPFGLVKRGCPFLCPNFSGMPSRGFQRKIQKKHLLHFESNFDQVQLY